MEQGGNDYPLGKNLKSENVFAVKDWKDTWYKLREII
jgi:hypothetical protein